MQENINFVHLLKQINKVLVILFEKEQEKKRQFGILVDE